MEDRMGLTPAANEGRRLYEVGWRKGLLQGARLLNEQLYRLEQDRAPVEARRALRSVVAQLGRMAAAPLSGDCPEEAPRG